MTCNCEILSQELIQVIDETLVVNSSTAIGGNTRNKTEVTLPEKTKAYIYRISIFPKGESSIANSLFDLLQQMGGANVAMASSFTQFAIKNSNNNAVDAFIFNNTYDSDNFYAKRDESWSACKSMANRVNCCFSTKECIGKQVFFGFRNNNITQGLEVKLEIVAVVDNSMEADYKYSYTIENPTGRDLKFQISTDKTNWKDYNLRDGYKQIFTFEQQEIYIRIYTDRLKFSSYKLGPNDRYRIIWNTVLQKWDIIKF